MSVENTDNFETLHEEPSKHEEQSAHSLDDLQAKSDSTSTSEKEKQLQLFIGNHLSKSQTLEDIQEEQRQTGITIKKISHEFDRQDPGINSLEPNLSLPTNFVIMTYLVTLVGLVCVIWSIVETQHNGSRRRSVGFGLVGITFLSVGVYYFFRIYKFRQSKTRVEQAIILNTLPFF